MLLKFLLQAEGEVAGLHGGKGGRDEAPVGAQGDGAGAIGPAGDEGLAGDGQEEEQEHREQRRGGVEGRRWVGEVEDVIRLELRSIA